MDGYTVLKHLHNTNCHVDLSAESYKGDIWTQQQADK